MNIGMDSPKNKSILYHLHILDEQYDACSDLSEYPC